MYEFELPGQSRGDVKMSPVDNLIINGAPIDTLIPGYTQLGVSGRSLISDEVAITRLPSRAGAYKNSNKVGERPPITVRYLMQAETSADMRRNYEMLNALLRDVNVDGFLELRFQDEPDWIYFGNLRAGNSLMERSLSHVGEFELYCPDPYKYSDIRVSQSLRNIQSIGQYVRPTAIQLRVPTACTSLEFKSLTMSGQVVSSFKLNGNYNQGTLITVEWSPEQVFVRSGYTTNITREIAFNTYPEEFQIPQGGTVQVVNNHGQVLNSEIEWRDRSL